MRHIYNSAQCADVFDGQHLDELPGADAADVRASPVHASTDKAERDRLHTIDRLRDLRTRKHRAQVCTTLYEKIWRAYALVCRCLTTLSCRLQAVAQFASRTLKSAHAETALLIKLQSPRYIESDKLISLSISAARVKAASDASAEFAAASDAATAARRSRAS